MTEPQTIQLVNPNLHVVMIHFPIAMLFVGTGIELLAFLWPRSTFRAAGRWMILIGALFTIPAATTGMFAARQAMAVSDLHWSDLKTDAHLNAQQWDNLNHHVKFNSIAGGLLAMLVVAWVGASDRIRRKGHPAYLVLLLVAVGLISVGAWRGGELVFANGTGVDVVKGGLGPPKNSSEMEHKHESASADKSKVVFDALRTTNDQIARFDDPLDIHTKLAGWTVALAVITLGLSIRGLWLNPNAAGNRGGNESFTSDDDIALAIAGRGEQRARGNPAPPRVELPARVPAGRFWLLVCLVGIITALVGWMLVGPGSMQDAVEMLKGSQRYMAHSIAGVSIVVLTLLLALITRFGPYNRLLIGGFSILLALVLAAQLWLGVLLMFDTSDGPVNRFNAPTTQSSMT